MKYVNSEDFGSSKKMTFCTYIGTVLLFLEQMYVKLALIQEYSNIS